MDKTIYSKKGVTVKQIQTDEGIRWLIASDGLLLTKDEVSDLGSTLIFRAVASGYVTRNHAECENRGR